MDNENKDYVLTTFDNPFNPFDDFETWFKYDSIILGYNTCSLLAKTANVSDVVSDEIQEKEIEEAIDEIIKRNPTLYKKAFRSDYEGKTIVDRVGGSV